MKLTQRWLYYALPLSALFWLTACGIFGPEAPPPPPPEPVKLKYVTYRLFGNVEEALVEAFEEANPHIQLELVQRRQPALNYLTDLEPPDLLMLSPGEQLSQAVAQGLITDLSELWQQTDLINSYPAAFRTLSEQDGKQFFMPLAYAWNAIYYNREVFARYNLQPPQTWDEFLELCETLLLSGEAPLVISGDDRLMATLWIDYLNLRLNGAEFHQQLNHGELSYTDEARLRAVFDLWRLLVERGYVLSDSRTLNEFSSLITLVRNEKLQVSQGKAAMALTGPVFLNEFPEPLRAELDFFPFPTLDAGFPTAEPVYVVGFVVPTAAPHRLEALEFLTFLNSEAGRAILAKDITASHLYVPAFASANSDDLPPQIQQGISLVQNAAQLTTPYGVNVQRTLYTPLNSMIDRLLADPYNAKPFDLDAELQKLEAARQGVTPP